MLNHANGAAGLMPADERPVHVLEIVGNAIVGGTERSVESLVESLPRERFVVSAVVPFEGEYAGRLRALGAEVLVTPIPDNPAWTSIQLVCSLVRSRAVDVLHAHLPAAHALAGIVGRLSHTPVLATIHGRQMSILDLEIHREAATNIAVVCQQSYFHALGLGVDEARLSCIPNGVDTARFRARQPQATDGTRSPAAPGLRSDLGIPDDAPLVGFVGRLAPEKGPEVFMRAAMLLRRGSPDAHFVLIGDGPMRQRLEDSRRQYGLVDRVLFAGLREDVAPLYNELDLLVCSSHSEAMPLAVMEAMASGLPVVATRVGGIPEILVEGVTGWLVEPGNFEAMAQRIEQLLRARDLRHTMGEAARRFACEHLDRALNTGRTAALLTRLATRRTAVRLGAPGSAPSHPFPSPRPDAQAVGSDPGTVALRSS